MTSFVSRSASVPATDHPTPAGDSSHSTLALSVHGCGFEMMKSSPSLTARGPFSYMKASIEEHPGPPLNQMTTGSVSGLSYDSAKT